MKFYLIQKLSLILSVYFVFFIFSGIVFASMPTDSEDPDGDGIAAAIDNCDTIANPDQSDTDADGIGDWCEEDSERFGFELNGGTAPNSIFSIFDSLGETLGLFFTFNNEKKAEKALSYAQEKLAEMRRMMAEGNEKAAKRASKKYDSFMELAARKLDNLREKENFSSLVGQSFKLSNAYQEIVRQNGKEDAPEFSKRADEIYSAMVAAYEAPQFPVMPAALTIEERRTRLCRAALERPLKDETTKLFETLCNGEFSAGTNYEEKKTILYTTLFEAMRRKDISNITKALLHQIILTHLSKEEVEKAGGAFLRRIFASMSDGEKKLLAQGDIFDPSFPPQEAGSAAREDQYINEVEQQIRQIRENCPAEGYSSYSFWVSCSVRDFVTGETYSDEYAESGGPCKYDEMGSVEKTQISSEINDYSGSQQATGPEGNMQVKRSKEIVCSVACASNNCSEHREAEGARKQCAGGIPPVYYLADNKYTDEMINDICTGRSVSDKIVPKEKPGAIGKILGGIKGLFGGGSKESRRQEGDEEVIEVDLGDSTRIIRTKKCVVSNCDEIELEFSWGKQKVKSCCCSCVDNDEIHRSRHVFDDWNWEGENLIDKVLSRKQDIIKKFEEIRDVFSQPTDQIGGDGENDAVDKDTTVTPAGGDTVIPKDLITPASGNAFLPKDAAAPAPASTSSSEGATKFFWLEMPADLGTHKVGETFSVPATIYRRHKTSYTLNGKSYDRLLSTEETHSDFAPFVHAPGNHDPVINGSFLAAQVFKPTLLTGKPSFSPMADDTFPVIGEFTCTAEGKGPVSYDARVFYDFYDELDIRNFKVGFDADRPETVKKAYVSDRKTDNLQAEGKAVCVKEIPPPPGDYTVSVYHKCSVAEGKNADGKFEAKLRAEVSVSEISAGGQVIYPKTNPIELRSGICESSASEIPICQDPRLSSESNPQSKSFAYTEEYRYPSNILKREIDKTVQEDMAFMTSGKRPCTSSDIGTQTTTETPVGSFEFLDSTTWQPKDGVSNPGTTHVIIATDGTPDVRTFLPISISVKGSNDLIWYTYFIANDPVMNCRDATGCSRDITIGSGHSGESFTVAARGNGGELLAEHNQ